MGSRRMAWLYWPALMPASFMASAFLLNALLMRPAACSALAPLCANRSRSVSAFATSDVLISMDRLAMSMAFSGQ